MNLKFSQRRNNLYLILGFFFLTNAIVAEFIGTKIFSLEKSIGIKPLNLSLLGDTFNLDMTAGVLLWPFVFILTDIINEYFGPKGVRKLSYITVIMLVYSFIMVRITMGLEGADFWLFSSKNLGISNMKNAFNSVFGQGLMIILGSLVAFLIGQIVDAFVFVADGRFHLESAMIHNPSVLSYQYNPYNKIITQEFYETPKMLVNRQNAITKAKDQTEWGIILGTLGRQGNVNILERLKKAMDDAIHPNEIGYGALAQELYMRLANSAPLK